MHILQPQNVIANWGVPNLGVQRNLPIDKVPDNALIDGTNVTIRGGTMRPRSGWVDLGVTGTQTGVPIGFATFTHFTGIIGLIGTESNLYSTPLPPSARTSRTGASTISAAYGNQSRFAAMYVPGSSATVVLHANGVNPPHSWSIPDAGVSGTFANASGSPPTFTDIATIGQHFIGLVPPYTVRWGNLEDAATWPSNNTKIISEFGDKVVAIQPLGTTAGVIFKESSLWLVQIRGGSDATFYSFAYRGAIEGPASPAAVVNAEGLLIWLSYTGRIYAFDGNTVREIGAGVTPYVTAIAVPGSGSIALDVVNSYASFGFYDSFYKEVQFWYPQLSASDTQCQVGVLVVLPRPNEGIPDFACFQLNATELTNRFSAGGDGRLVKLAATASKGPYILGHTGSKIYTGKDGTLGGGGTSDDGTAFTCQWDHPPRPAKGLDTAGLEAFETFWETGLGGTQDVQVAPITSFNLANGGTVQTAKTVDTSPANTTVVDFRGTDVNARFFGLRVSTDTSTVAFRFRGARLSVKPSKG